MENEVLKNILQVNRVRGNKTPTVHFITNFVTMNDVAQAAIYMGGKPVMAHWEEEVMEITSIASSLVLNLGTPDEGRIRGIRKAAHVAAEKRIPVILDPVGIHVSSKRRELAFSLLDESQVMVIKGNYSEVMALLNIKSSFIGIDSLEEDVKGEVVEGIKEFSSQRGVYIVITGKNDYVFGRGSAIKIMNGTQLLSKVTGTGCILSAILGTLCGKAEKNEELFSLCAAGVLINSISGEKADVRIRKGGEGLHSFKHYYMDELSLIEDKEILEMGMIEYV